MRTGKGKGYKVIAPDRFLTTTAFDGAVTVVLAGKTVATSRHAILLNEGDRAPVAYLPKRDLVLATLAPSMTEYRCRWKGDAVYFNVESEQDTIADGAWAYPQAPDDLQVLRECIAFDANAFDIQLANGVSKRGNASLVETETEKE